jgi:hypothetical protein
MGLEGADNYIFYYSITICDGLHVALGPFLALPLVGLLHCVTLCGWSSGNLHTRLRFSLLASGLSFVGSPSRFISTEHIQSYAFVKIVILV